MSGGYGKPHPPVPAARQQGLQQPGRFRSQVRPVIQEQQRTLHLDLAETVRAKTVLTGYPGINSPHLLTPG